MSPVSKNEKKLLLRLLTAEEQLENLRQAVYELYFSAWWTGDRPTDDLIWSKVRDAAGIPPGAARAVLGEINLATGRSAME